MKIPIYRPAPLPDVDTEKAGKVWHPLPPAGTGIRSGLEAPPSFLSAATLKPYLNDDLLESSRIIEFIDITGHKAVGYEATLLPSVAEVYLRLRDDAAANNRPVPFNFRHVVKQCDTAKPRWRRC